MQLPGDRVRQAWHEPWDELAGSEEWAHPLRFSRASHLYLPALLCLIVQVPGVFLRVQLGTGPRLEPRWDAAAPLLLNLAIALAGPLALLGARRWPGPVVAVTAVAASADLLLYADTDRPPYLALAFAIVSGVVRGARLWAWLSIAVVWVATLVVAISLRMTLTPLRIAAITLGILIVLGVGEGIRARRERYAELSRRMAQRKQSELQAERVRIARELHDVLAHSLSQINVQAGVGLHLMQRRPEQAAQALASIKEASKSALDEVRSVLGALRAEDPTAPLVPEPDLSGLARLAASIEAQGLRVTVDDAIDSVPPAAVQLALYRIAQESFTNVLRHAHATAVTLAVSADDTAWTLRVDDDGRGAATASEDSRGLLGMHERAELLGGTLEAGPRSEGGFRVVARIPRGRR